MLAQATGDAVGPLVELLIAEGRILENTCRGLRRFPSLKFKELMQSLSQVIFNSSLVPGADHLFDFSSRQQRDFRNRLIGRLDKLLHHPLQMTEHPDCCSITEQVSAVFQFSAEDVRELGDGHPEIELRDGLAKDNRFNFQVGNAAVSGVSLALEIEHHLEERVATHIPFKLQFIHELLKRQVLVLVSSDSHLLDAAQ